MIEAAGADVVCPAIATDDPHALAHERVGELEQGGRVGHGIGVGDAGQRRLQAGDPLALGTDAELAIVVDAGDKGIDCCGPQRRLELRPQAVHQHQCSAALRLETESDAETELGIVLEQAVGPGRAPALAVHRVRRGGQVAAEDAAAPSGVGHQQVVAEQLREQLQVGSFAATGARTRELEQGLAQLTGLHRGRVPLGRVGDLDTEEGVPRNSLAIEVIGDRAHVDALALHLALVVCRARLHAHTATGAVVGRDLDGEAHSGHVAAAEGLRLHRVAQALQRRRLVDLHADRRVRADDRTLAAIDAQVRFPYRDLGRDGALLVPRGAGDEAAIGRQRAHRQEVALPRQHASRDSLYEVGGIGAHRRAAMRRRGHGRADRYTMQVLQRLVDRGHVARHHGLAACAVAVMNGVLQFAQRVLGRKHPGESEETGLHDRVDATTEAGFAGDSGCIHGVHLQVAIEYLLLHFCGKATPHLVGGVRRVEQHGRTLGGQVQYVEAIEEVPLVDAHERGLVDEVRAVDGMLVHAHVADRRAARLLRVVDEVSLHVQIGVGPDDPRRVFVATHRAICAEAVEHGPDLRPVGPPRWIPRQAGVADVIVNADREGVARQRRRCFVEHCLHHGGRELLAAEPVAATNHARLLATCP